MAYQREAENDRCVLMPTNVDNMMKKFDDMTEGQKEVQNISERQVLDGLDPPFRQYAHYGFKSMEIGRPLDSLMIVMIGPLGAGKSTTINKLFGDPYPYQSKHVVTQYSKLLRIKNMPFPVEGYLSMVKICETDNAEYEEHGFSPDVFKFRNEHSCLANPCDDFSEFASRWNVTIRTPIYPNIVLFTFDASDKRMLGTTSQMRQSLNLANKYKLIDKVNNNLILVGTQCCSLALTRIRFKEMVDNIKKRLLRLVEEELGISNAEIVFIENSPENFQLEKSDGGFYKLPNDEYSHLNLIEAIKARLESNDDCYGELLANHYFMSNAPEKNDKATVSVTQNTQDPPEKNAFQRLYIQYGCFPLESNVLTAGISWQPLSKISKLSRVMTAPIKSRYPTETNKMISTNMCTFIHIDRDCLTEYCVIEMDNGSHLTITPEHLLFIVSDGQIKTIQSRNVTIGDSVLCVDANSSSTETVGVTTIISIRKKIIRGACAPLTEAGTLFVDGILVSCYADVSSHRLAHLSMTPLFLWIKCHEWSWLLMRSVTPKKVFLFDEMSCNGNASELKNTQVCPEDGIHLYARVLMFLRRLFYS